MYNDISLRKKGFYGEGVPADAGIVVTVKTHGHTTGKGAHEERPAQVLKKVEFIYLPYSDCLQPPRGDESFCNSADKKSLRGHYWTQES